VYVHLTSYTDVFPVISDIVKLISHYCIKYSRSNSCIGKNAMFCMQRYKCNVEMVFSGQINNITESHFIRRTYVFSVT